MHYEKSYYRTWTNYVYIDSGNKKTFNTNLTLKQWNKLKPILLFRFRYQVKSEERYLGLQPVSIDETYPLYKFWFQNVIKARPTISSLSRTGT